MEWLRRWLGRGRAPALTPELEQRIRASFDEAASDEEHFPSSIDPRIYHVRLVLEEIGDVNGKRVLDVGCGKGRFARIVKDENPRAAVIAADLSPAMLGYASPDLERCAASMNSLPFADATFAAAYATESLEHAVDIERAVAEICRVVSPGGAIVIIDKNAEHWGKLKTPEWERWFAPRELEALLRRYCRSVSWRYISYWEDVAPDGMFVAWCARR
jgi:ubiquinone/menaquinone biosynthesis C-methylase UbiE